MISKVATRKQYRSRALASARNGTGRILGGYGTILAATAGLAALGIGGWKTRQWRSGSGKTVVEPEDQPAPSLPVSPTLPVSPVTAEDVPPTLPVSVTAEDVLEEQPEYRLAIFTVLGGSESNPGDILLPAVTGRVRHEKIENDGPTVMHVRLTLAEIEAAFRAKYRNDTLLSKATMCAVLMGKHEDDNYTIIDMADHIPSNSMVVVYFTDDPEAVLLDLKRDQTIEVIYKRKDTEPVSRQCEGGEKITSVLLDYVKDDIEEGCPLYFNNTKIDPNSLSEEMDLAQLFAEHANLPKTMNIVTC